MNWVAGALSALQRCLLETPNSVYDTLDPSLNMEVLGLLENISLLLLGVLYGDPEACASEKGNRTVCRNTSHLVQIYFYTSREITLSRPRCTAFLLWYGKCHQLSDSPNICRWPGRGRGVCPALWRAQPCSHLLLGLPQGIAVDVDAQTDCWTLKMFLPLW